MSTRPTPPPQKPASDLTFSKVLAAAGAAATAAVLGALFGVAGTVLGAAIGAVASTVTTSFYQRSLDRASSSIVSRIRPGDPEATTVMSPDEPATVLISPAAPPRRSRRRIVGYVVATVLGFVLALGAVTGVEAIAGGTLISGQAGTSVGRVLGGEGDRSTTKSAEPTADPSTDDNSGKSSQYDHRRNDSSSTPTASATATPKPSSTRTPGTSAPNSSDGSNSGSQSGIGGILGGSGG